MTLQEQMDRRRAELDEFFAWRFGTRKFGPQLRRVLKKTPRLFGPTTAPILVRKERAALRLGFRPHNELEVTQPPPPHRGIMYFERERKAKKEWLAKCAVAFRKGASRKVAYHRKYNPSVLIDGIYVEHQGLVKIRTQECLSREILPMRARRCNTRSPAPAPAQLELGL
jgi:hypothetical protein